MNQWIMRWAPLPAVGMVLRVACVALMVAACGHQDTAQLQLSEAQHHKERMKKKQMEEELEKRYPVTSLLVGIVAHNYREEKLRDSKPIDQCLSDPGKNDRL